MKKLFLTTIVCLLAAVGMQAQSGKWGVGLNLGYGTEVSKAYLGGRVLYDIDDRFDVVGSFNHYFKDHEVKFWDINADFHWNAIRRGLFEFYPLVGITILHKKFDGHNDLVGASLHIDDSDSWFGVNLGAGIMFNLTDHWKLGGELKGQIMSDSQFVPQITAMYRF